MKLERRSIVLSASFPESKHSSEEMVEAIKIAAKSGIQVVEFYFEGTGKETVKQALQMYNLSSIYLGAVPAKTQKYHLCALDKDRRMKAVAEMKRCIDEAVYFGSERILINGGAKPKKTGHDEDAYKSLKLSLQELLQYSSESDPSLIVTFEPGDSNIEYFELVGKTELAVKLAEEMEQHYDNFRLTVDTSHLKQLNEDYIESIKKSYNHCDHIHLANCYLIDVSSPMYGDKHPAFSEKSCEFDKDSIKAAYEKIMEIYDNKDVIITQEIICRKDNALEFFRRCKEDTPWFYNE